MTISIPSGRTISLQAKAGGGFESVGLALGATGDPLVRFDFANGDTTESGSINKTGFSWQTSKATSLAPNGQSSLEFAYLGAPAKSGFFDSEVFKELRYSMGTQLFETYERIVMWIPSNFKHRKLTRLTLQTSGSADSWVKGDVVTGADGTSEGLFERTAEGFVWLLYANNFSSNSAWVGDITNAARASTVTTTARTFGSPSSNNKFSAQWEGTYSGNASIFEYDTSASNLVETNSFFTCKHTAGAGTSSGDGGPDSSATTGNRTSSTSVPPGIDLDQDLGVLTDFVIRRRRASALGADDGITQMWKDGVLAYEDLAVPLFSATANYYDTGYIMGYANSGFLEDTSFYITKFELYDSTRPDGIPS